MDEETKKQFLSEINDLIQLRQQDIFKNYPRIRDIYIREYEGDTELNPLRNEISICLIFGLYQAAITLTNHMIEKYLKIALIYKNAIFEAAGNSIVEKLVNATSDSTEKYNSNSMEENINAACTQGIITKDDKKKLKEIRDIFRNAYSHADAKKIHSDVSIPLTGVKITDNGFVGENESVAEIAMLPMLQGIAQVYHAEANAIPYFCFIDSLIRRTRPNIFNKSKP